MSWDERLFGRLYARLTGRGARAAAARGIAVEPERVRLELIASALAGQRITVALATGPGGLRGHHLIVPPQLDVLPTPEANAGLLLARIVVGAIVLRDPPPLAPGDDAQALATFAAVVRARRAIADELPGAAVVVDAAAAALLGLRGPISAGPDGALEAAAQLALGRAADDLVGFDPRWLAAVARGDRAVVLGPAAGGRCAALALCGWLGVDGPRRVDDRSAGGGADRQPRWARARRPGPRSGPPPPARRAPRGREPAGPLLREGPHAREVPGRPQAGRRRRRPRGPRRRPRRARPRRGSCGRRPRPAASTAPT
jgi:hypothetical protein